MPGLSRFRPLVLGRSLGSCSRRKAILHSVELTAIFNYNVRLATGLGLRTNPEYQTLGRKLDE